MLAIGLIPTFLATVLIFSDSIVATFKAVR